MITKWSQRVFNPDLEYITKGEKGKGNKIIVICFCSFSTDAEKKRKREAEGRQSARTKPGGHSDRKMDGKNPDDDRQNEENRNASRKADGKNPNDNRQNEENRNASPLAAIDRCRN